MLDRWSAARTILPRWFFVLLLGLLVPLSVSNRADATPRSRLDTWTVLVYLAGDNNLDEWGWYSLDLMSQGLSDSGQVQVLALYDHYGSGAELIAVSSDGLEVLADAGEPDTGDPATLAAFVAEGMTLRPADHTLLVLWDHGGGWKFFAKDSTSGTRMPLDGVADALEQAAIDVGQPVDVVLFDACLMATIEVAYELRHVTDFVVASTHTVDLDGFPYDRIVARLDAAQSPDPAVAARGAADDFYDAVIRSNAKAALSVSAIETALLAPLVDAVSRLAIDTMASGLDQGAVQSARSNAEHQVWGGGSGGVFWFVDLVRFADALADGSRLPTLAGDADAVAEAHGQAVYFRGSHNIDGFSHGLTINFPPNEIRYWDENYLAQNYQGIDLDFPDDSAWDEMLLWHYAK
jgi:hypothetical protein